MLVPRRLTECLSGGELARVCGFVLGTAGPEIRLLIRSYFSKKLTVF